MIRNIVIQVFCNFCFTIPQYTSLIYSTTHSYKIRHCFSASALKIIRTFHQSKFRLDIVPSLILNLQSCVRRIACVWFSLSYLQISNSAYLVGQNNSSNGSGLFIFVVFIMVFIIYKIQCMYFNSRASYGTLCHINRIIIEMACCMRQLYVFVL